MSARGGQWIAAGALVVVGIGILIYLSRKPRKKPGNVSETRKKSQKSDDSKSNESNASTTKGQEKEEENASPPIRAKAVNEQETRIPSPKIDNLKPATDPIKKSGDEKKTKIPVPKSLGKTEDQIKPVIEKPLQAENMFNVSASPQNASMSSPGNHSEAKNNEQKPKASSPLCERLEKTAPPEAQKTVSLNASPGKSTKSTNSFQKSPSEQSPIQTKIEDVGPVLSPQANSSPSPPGGVINSETLPSGSILSPTQKIPAQSRKYDKVSIPKTKNFSAEEITDALLLAQNMPGMLSAENADILVSVLTHPDPSLQLSALMGINKCSTFTRNQNLLREHGCLSQLSHLLHQQVQNLSNMSQNASASEEDPEKSKKNPNNMSERFMNLLATAINNLSSNEENHKQFEDCVPMLVDIALEEETGESVRLSSLQALTNLSVMDHHHNHYTRIIQRLYDFLDDNSAGIRLQAAKILVNLSCNSDLVPHMLAAKAPSCVLDLLRTTADEAMVLRWTTFLANILHTVRESHLSASSLPPDDKAPSPETMYSALYGMNNIGHIKSKVFLLCQHKNEDIKHQASRIYQTLNAK